MPAHTTAPTSPPTTPYSGKSTSVPGVTARNGAEVVADGDGPGPEDEGVRLVAGDDVRAAGLDVPGDDETVGGGDDEAADVPPVGDVLVWLGLWVGVRVGLRVGVGVGCAFASLSRVLTAAASRASMPGGSGA